MLRKMLFGMAGAMLAANAPAATADNPYDQIVERNVFGLKPLTVQTNITPQADPPSKIVPTGLTTVLGRKLALFKVQSPAKPPQPAKEESFILAEGQRSGDIEVVRIDEDSGEITFRNKGVLLALSLEKDGAKIPQTPPNAQPGPPSVGSAPGVTPSPLPPTGTTYRTTNNFRSVPMRQALPPPPPVPTPNSVPVPNSQAQTYNNPAVATAPGNTAVGQPTQQQPLTPEQQALLIELERATTNANGAQPAAPPAPVAPQ